RDWRDKRDMQGQGSHLAIVARHSAISRRTVMDMQVRGEHDWFSSTGLEEKAKKILPVVGRRKETYNIWGVERRRRMRLSHLSPNRFVGGLNGNQFLGKKELHVFFDHGQLCDICRPKRFEIRHHLFDQHFWRRSSGGNPNRF